MTETKLYSFDPYEGFFGADHRALNDAMEYVFGSAVPGDVIEFGCHRGRSTRALAKAMRDSYTKYGSRDRDLWALDSFEGFPEADNPVDGECPHVKIGSWRAGAPAGGSPAQIMSLCAQHLPAERIHVIAGWFKDTLAQIPPSTRFAFVHVDCDYYESTSQVLTHLFDNAMLSDGATILFDDWYCNRGSPDYGEQKAWAEAITKFRPRFTDWGPYGIVGRRFIVHQ